MEIKPMTDKLNKGTLLSLALAIIAGISVFVVSYFLIQNIRLEEKLQQINESTPIWNQQHNIFNQHGVEVLFIVSVQVTPNITHYTSNFTEWFTEVQLQNKTVVFLGHENDWWTWTWFERVSYNCIIAWKYRYVPGESI